MFNAKSQRKQLVSLAFLVYIVLDKIMSFHLYSFFKALVGTSFSFTSS